MPSILQLSPHIANLIAAGEVVERPASVIKELLENAVDAGATKVTAEIRDGGMTFLRVTDNGCGMEPQDAPTAFLRHATSKLRSAEDLASVTTMGFRGEALAAIASVSRIDLMTRPEQCLTGTSLHLEAGNITESSEAGCPRGTTIVVRDLFFNTPARMKFMKSDTVEGSRVTAAVQLQALAHPEVAFTFLRDGKSVLSTPGTGSLRDAVYCIYGREFAQMAPVQSKWDSYQVSGFVCRPSDARPSRNLQTFFVNDRPVKSKLLVSALEEAYRNQLMVGKFPTCVLHLKLPANAVDVNVHPAKTEVKFLNEKSVFDCVHYGVLAALNKTPDRPELQFRQPPKQQAAPMPPTTSPAFTAPAASPTSAVPAGLSRNSKQDFFKTMTPEEFKRFSTALQEAPKPNPEAAAAVAAKLPSPPLRAPVALPQFAAHPAPTQAPSDCNRVCHAFPASAAEPVPAEAAATVPAPAIPAPATVASAVPASAVSTVPASAVPADPVSMVPPPASTVPTESVLPAAPEPVQQSLPMPEASEWRMVGELFRTYILIEQGTDAFLIDKHAAHERILFEKLKANQEAISSQTLLMPVPVQLDAASAAVLLTNRDMLTRLGFEIEEFGENTILLRQIPMDLSQEDAAATIESLAADLRTGRREEGATIRDALLHTVACKAAIKAGWTSDEQELLVLARQVMCREDLKHCPHGRPICITLSKHQIEKQFRRT